MPSTPGLPLFALTRANACLQFSRSQTSSINCSPMAGLSALRFAVSDSVPSREAVGASLLLSSRKASTSWFFCRLSLMSCAAYSPLPLTPCGDRSGLHCLRSCRVGGGAPKRWPPSAAQTARTVFPYAAFTKTQHYEMREKELTPPSSQAHTHRTAWPEPVASNRHSANA